MKTMAAGILLLSATVANAQSQNCAPFEMIDERLQSRYGEQVRTVGIANGGQSIVMQYANEESGTWTMIVRNANGIACMVASGEGWQLLEAEVEGDAL